MKPSPPVTKTFLTKTVGFEIALTRGLPATFDGAVDAITHTLQKSGFDTTRAQLRDASGLSTDNRISAHLIDQVLTAAAGPDTPELRPLLDTLPVAAATGTLADRFNPPSPRSRVGARENWLPLRRQFARWSSSTTTSAS